MSGEQHLGTGTERMARKQRVQQQVGNFILNNQSDFLISLIAATVQGICYEGCWMYISIHNLHIPLNI